MLPMIEESGNPNLDKKASLERDKQEPYLIVEVGSGDSPFLLQTSEDYRERFRKNPSVRYIGVDRDEAELRYGKNLVERKDDKIDLDLDKTGRVHYVNSKGELLPFAANSISELILKNVISDKDISPRKKIGMIHEAARVLKPGGVMKIIEQYIPRFARAHDVGDYLDTVLRGTFEPVRSYETTGIFDERETDRLMMTPSKSVKHDSFILRFRKKAANLDPPG